MAQQLAPRLKAILDELDRAVAEYATVREEFETIRIRMEVASEHFAHVKELARTMLDPGWQWWQWQTEHPAVKYVGALIGTAILDVLHDTARVDAWEHVEGKRKAYFPWMVISTIATRLEEGGFEFRSTTPNREVNAALIKLAGTVKHPQIAAYTLEDNVRANILENARSMAASLSKPAPVAVAVQLPAKE